MVGQRKNIDSVSELDLATLPSGIYVVQISNGNEHSYKRRVIE